MRHKTHFLKDDIFKLFIRYLIPSVFAMLMVSVYIFFDTIFIGRGIGTDGLAALNIAIPIYSVLLSIGLLFGVGGATALSVSIGQGKQNKLNEIFTYSVAAAFIIGAFVTVFGIIFIDRLAYFLGADESTFHLVKEYLIIILSFSLSFILVSTLTVFIRHDGAPKLAMWGSAMGSILNIILDAVFIFVFKWGMAGAAIATVISSVLNLFLLIYYHFIIGNSKLKFIRLIPQIKLIKRILLNGIPSFIIEISSGIVIFAFNNVLNNIIGTIGISAYSIIANISLICAAIFTGIAQASQPIISVNYGAGQYSRVKKVVKLGTTFALTCGVIFFSVGMLLPEQIIKLFNNDSSELLRITSRGISIYFISYIFMGLNIVLGAYFQSMEHSTFSTILSSCRGIIFVILGVLVLPYFFSIDGVWLTVPLAEIITLVLSVIFFLRLKIIKS
jgi:putative MATE family efflux protein